MDIQPAQKVTLIEAVTRQLLTLIREGHLKPGDSLPSERELMERLHVGRSSVREALRSLATMRAIEIRPGRGAFVRTPVTEDLVPSDTLRMLIDRDAMIEIVEAREVLEVALVSMAAERATEEDLAELSAIIEEMERSVADPEHSLALNARFHLAIAEAARNPVLLKMLQSVGDYLELRLRELGESEGQMKKSLAGHRHIYESIRSRDRDLAARAMLDHLRSVRLQVEAGS
jgi:GntR family transcriptional regulator, transcriptional repressor for pyruvate dehydrogenase complex